MRSKSKSRHRFEGFTLVELMTVITIVAVSAALAAPSFTRAMAISRADRANHDIVRVLRFARSQSIAFGRTYLAHMDTTGNGRLELWEGTTSACRLEDWAGVMSMGSCAAGAIASGNCVDFVDSATYTTTFHGVRFSSNGGLDICFQPNGESLTRGSSSLGQFAYAARGAAAFVTERLEGGVSMDPPRGGVVPISGSPRSGVLAP